MRTLVPGRGEGAGRRFVRTWRLTQAVLFGIALLSCTRAEPSPGSQRQEIAQFDPATRVILPSGLSPQILGSCNAAFPEGAVANWMPPVTLVDSIDRQLAVLLDSVITKLDSATTRPGLAANDYYRQYAGLSWGQSRRIYIIGFHRDIFRSVGRGGADSLQWRKFPVTPCDRGATTFGVLYEPREKRFTQLMFGNRMTGPIRY